MKNIFKLIVVGILLMSINASAQTISYFDGYHAFLVFNDGSSNSPTGSQESCEKDSADIIEAKESRGIHYLPELSLPCGRRDESWNGDQPKINDMLGANVPRCLSCPFMNKDTIGILFPDHKFEIEELYFSYKINMYNKKFNALQKTFNLESFEDAVYKTISSKGK